MMEGTITLIENPNLMMVVEKSGNVYWVKGWVYYPVPDVRSDKVVTSWSLRVEGWISLLVEKVAEEKRWTISRIFSALYPSRDIFIRNDEGEKNYERLVDHLNDKFKERLITEIRSAVTSKFQIDDSDIVKLNVINPKISLTRPKDRNPTVLFGVTVYITLRLPVKLFYERLSYSRKGTTSELSFFGDAVYEAVPDELKNPESATELLTETYPIVKREYKLIPQKGPVEVEIWSVDVPMGSTSKAALSVMEFSIPLPKETAEALLKNRDNPEGILSNLVVFLSFFPDGKISIGKRDCYVRAHEVNEFEMFHKPASVMELTEALQMFSRHGLKGGSNHLVGERGNSQN